MSKKINQLFHFIYFDENGNAIYFMKYKSEILEMAKIACATVPDDLCDRMDISDDYFLEIRDYIQWESDEKWRTTEE